MSAPGDAGSDDLILTTFDWVPDTPRVTCVTYGCVGHWKRLDCTIESKAYRLAPEVPSTSRTNPSRKCRG